MHGRVRGAVLSTHDSDASLARDSVARLHSLALRVAADVDEHNTRVGEVDKELSVGSGQSDCTVSGLVKKLMQANEAVQKKLSETEGKLEDLSNQLEHHASEARTDVLTGLANRRAFDEESEKQLSQYKESESSFALMIIDIDRFKQVNDEYGHTFGDEILRGVGCLMTQNLRGRDSVTRYGGEEFAVMLPQSTMGDARRAAEMIRETVQNARFPMGDKEVRITISIGVAEVLPYEDVKSLVKRADQAMYAAKRGGRNRVYWHDGTLSHPANPNSVCRRAAKSGDPASKAVATPPRLFNDADPEMNADAAVRASEKPRAVDAAEDAIDLVAAASLSSELLKNMGNKTMFCQDIHRRVAEFNRGGTTFSTILLSVDDYSQLARKFGENAGKIVLCAVAQALELGLRDMDLVARYSETTFGLVLPKATLRDAVCIGERMRKTIAKKGVLVEGQEVRFTVSLGIVEVVDGDVMATLVERARAELGLAATNGGNRSGFATAS